MKFALLFPNTTHSKFRQVHGNATWSEYWTWKLIRLNKELWLAVAGYVMWTSFQKNKGDTRSIKHVAEVATKGW